MSHSLLFEIGMEECPARFIDRALADFEEALKEALASERVAHGAMKTFGTPRRLTVRVEGLAARQEDLTVEVKGPPVRIAFDEAGNPTKAASGFAARQGVAVDELVTKEVDGGEHLVAVKREIGQSVQQVLPKLLSDVVASLRFPKSMRWNEEGLRFARPIRWIVALLDEDIIDVEIAGVRAGRTTFGHRFLAKEPIELSSPAEYETKLLEAGYVMVDVQKREETIRRQAESLGQQVGGTVEIEEGLLREVTHLVEYPTALLGSFDAAYLEVPQEILVTSMREHQKYFPVRGGQGELLPHFVAVRNGDASSLEVVQAGNERVLAARLADARFFYDEDRKKPLVEYAEALKNVVFQEQLGSVWDKVERVRASIKGAAKRAGFDDDVLLGQADRAAVLAKADLVTQVVYEFPELQGVMGREYARLSGEVPEVAEAVFEHYLPRFAQDELPRTAVGAMVALADKVDTIVGCFGVGLIPTGSADPYALRRQALGVIRILRQERLPHTLGGLIDAALASFEGRLADLDKVRQSVLDFFAGRLSALFGEEGARYDLVAASIALGVEDLRATQARVRTLTQLRGSDAFAAVFAVFHRAKNLAANAQSDEVRPALFEDGAENSLYETLQATRDEVEPLIQARRYEEAIEVLAGLKTPLDTFFDRVLVMAKDPQVKQNRLALLKQVVDLVRQVAAWEHIAEE